ncbi:MAG: TrmH family RNA methyltransferase [Desulfobacterales bacterium]|nr:TrmH family RNA methyltransferase [Desulfobacterales bacterium]
MGLRQLRRKLQQQRIAARKRFRRQRNANRLAAPGAHRFIIVLDSLKPAFNVGKIFRSADAFGAREVHLVGIDFFDPAPSMGSFKWVPARFHEHFASVYRDLASRDYTLFALQPEKGPPLNAHPLPRRSAFIFGHEEYGLSFDPADYPDIQPLTIPQFGQVQSLNVSNAAAVVMWEFLRQHHLDVASREPAASIHP